MREDINFKGADRESDFWLISRNSCINVPAARIVTMKFLKLASSTSWADLRGGMGFASHQVALLPTQIKYLTVLVKA